MQVTSGFGWRLHPITGERRFHGGVDLVADADTVFAIADGRVSTTGYEPGYGLFIRVSHAGGLQSLYGHLSLIGVSPGDSVTVAEPLGLSGSTGRATGPHLHFAIIYQQQHIDPLKFLCGWKQFSELLKQPDHEKNHESTDR